MLLTVEASVTRCPLRVPAEVYSVDQSKQGLSCVVNEDYSPANSVRNGITLTPAMSEIEIMMPESSFK